MATERVSASKRSSPGRKPPMASLVLKMSVSLDGYIAPTDAAPTGSLRDVPMTAPVGMSRR